jgi:hypothetical protein
MYTIILAIFIAFITVSIVIFFDDDGISNLKDKLLATLFGTFMIGSAFSMIGLVIASEIGSKNYTLEEVNSNNIVSLNNHQSVSGSFVLGCGSIDSKEYYMYFIKDNNSYQRGKAPYIDGSEYVVKNKYNHDSTQVKDKRK